ncbi:MAG: leucyl/phenylalanyl-tRNA--protein transferase [Alphaproteobacteria bacterium]|nr:leucyl/phenylalanyl-tRNA--protein transferase [Alphaproteobacteria bacterium]
MSAQRLTPQHVLDAYKMGIFPMADSATSHDLHWYRPPLRALLPVDHFHVPTRLRRWMKHTTLRVTFDQAFAEVIRACGTRTATRRETWINAEIIHLFTQLHVMGHAHSVEVWRGDALVGGLYGLHLGAAFFGESMFSRETNASKLALVRLVEHLQRQNFTLLDAQFSNPHLTQFGLYEISQENYEKQLQNALMVERKFMSFMGLGA